MSAQPQANVIEVGRSIGEIVADLSKPIPERFLRERKQGNQTLTYIPWHEATKLLDHYAPGWDYSVQLQHIAGKVVAIATLSIPTDKGHVSRQATGNEDDDKDSFGDPFSNSESMALRRAAAKFGLGRYLYK
jgi:hypothetical protein